MARPPLGDNAAEGRRVTMAAHLTFAENQWQITTLTNHARTEPHPSGGRFCLSPLARAGETVISRRSYRRDSRGSTGARFQTSPALAP